MIRPILAICMLSICGLAVAQSQAARIKAFDIAKAKELIADEFSDPDSVKFRRMFISELMNPKGEAVLYLCGEVNAKNRMGGYTGYRRFLVDQSMALVDPGADAEGMASVHHMMIEAAYPKTCANRVKDIK